MATSDTGVIRCVKCPKCFSILQEPNDPVYQCGKCGTNLRAKNRATQDKATSTPSSSVLPPQTKHFVSSDYAITSTIIPDAPSTRNQGIDTRNHGETGRPIPGKKHVSEVPYIRSNEDGQSANQEANTGNSENCRERNAGGEECILHAPGVSLHFSERKKDGMDLSDSEQRRTLETRPAASKKDSSESAQPRPHDIQELPGTPAGTADFQSARAKLEQESDAPAATERKVPSPRDDIQRKSFRGHEQLQTKILKTVDELRDDLSELFGKSEGGKPRVNTRPPGLPKQEGYRSRMAMASSVRTRARHPTANHHESASQVAPRGLPSRRYRQRRLDPWFRNAQAGHCYHNCCHNNKTDCSYPTHSCRSTTQEPSLKNQPAEFKRRPPPRHHCRPVLKGAPFIICSTCFTLVQLPADFVIWSKTVRKLQCGSCSEILSYSYRDQGGKKPQQPIDPKPYNTDGSDVHMISYGQADPFSFIEDYGQSFAVSSSTEDVQPLHVSRVSSFDSVNEKDGVRSSLHRLMGYPSASELLWQSPDLYESLDKRTPDQRQYDRKGKGICIDDESDEEDSGALKRSNVRGFGLPLQGILKKGIPALGPLKIKA